MADIDIDGVANDERGGIRCELFSENRIGAWQIRGGRRGRGRLRKSDGARRDDFHIELPVAELEHRGLC